MEMLVHLLGFATVEVKHVSDVAEWDKFEPKCRNRKCLAGGSELKVGTQRKEIKEKLKQETVKGKE
jgi:hypothetical protein